jgi:hypothetical protein
MTRLGAYTGDKWIAQRVLVGKPLRRQKVQYSTTHWTYPVKLGSLVALVIRVVHVFCIIHLMTWGFNTRNKKNNLTRWWSHWNLYHAFRNDYLPSSLHLSRTSTYITASFSISFLFHGKILGELHYLVFQLYQIWVQVTKTLFYCYVLTVKFRGPSVGNEWRNVYGCSTHSVLSHIFQRTDNVRITHAHINRYLLNQSGWGWRKETDSQDS